MTYKVYLWLVETGRHVSTLEVLIFKSFNPSSGNDSMEVSDDVSSTEGWFVLCQNVESTRNICDLKPRGKL